MKKHWIITLTFLAFSTQALASYVAPPYEIGRGGTGSSSQTASRAVTTDGSGSLVSSSSTTSSEIGFVHGVTSAIQTQINGLATTTLNNLGSTALNASLLPASSGSANLGSALFPFGTDFANILELMGSSSGNVQLKAAASTSAYTVTLPAAVCSSGQYWADNGSGVMSCTSPSNPNLTVVNGGDAAYSVQSGDGHVRSGTALTAGRTYTLDACTGSNIGERHEIKNIPSQTFNLTVAGNGSDQIDGAGTYVLQPGDSVSIICSAFSTSGTWDIE